MKRLNTTCTGIDWLPWTWAMIKTLDFSFDQASVFSDEASHFIEKQLSSRIYRCSPRPIVLVQLIPETQMGNQSLTEDVHA